MRVFACAAVVACTSPRPMPPAPPPPVTAVRPVSLVPDCYLGRDHCRIVLDLDGDARPDRLETVRDGACAASDDDRRCRQGFWLALASGATQVVGAGVALAPDPTASADQEPIALEADLGFVTFLGLTHRRTDGGRPGRPVVAAPCAGDAVLLSGGDAAFMLCWRGGAARAYHLGF